MALLIEIEIYFFLFLKTFKFDWKTFQTPGVLQLCAPTHICQREKQSFGCSLWIYRKTESIFQRKSNPLDVLRGTSPKTSLKQRSNLLEVFCRILPNRKHRSNIPSKYRPKETIFLQDTFPYIHPYVQIFLTLAKQKSLMWTKVVDPQRQCCQLLVSYFSTGD